jgi:hypothetical protein
MHLTGTYAGLRLVKLRLRCRGLHFLWMRAGARAQIASVFGLHPRTVPQV